MQFQLDIEDLLGCSYLLIEAGILIEKTSKDQFRKLTQEDVKPFHHLRYINQVRMIQGLTLINTSSYFIEIPVLNTFQTNQFHLSADQQTLLWDKIWIGSIDTSHTPYILHLSINARSCFETAFQLMSKLEPVTRPTIETNPVISTDLPAKLEPVENATAKDLQPNDSINSKRHIIDTEQSGSSVQAAKIRDLNSQHTLAESRQILFYHQEIAQRLKICDVPANETVEASMFLRKTP